MLFVGLIAAATLADSLSIQASRVDITPPEPLPLGGYTARGNKVFQPSDDRLYARAVVIRGGSRRIAVVSCEMLTIPGSLYEAVRKGISKDTDLFLAATHTHSAPDSQMLNDHMTFAIPGIASFKQRWLDWYAGKISAAVIGAEHSTPRQVHRLGLSEYLESLNRGRRQSASPDQTATILYADKRPLLFSYAAHGTLFGPERLKVSGDWPGSVAQILGCPVLVGAIGDVSPHAPGNSPEEMIQALSGRLVQGAEKQPIRPIWQAGEPFAELEAPIPLDAVRANPTMGAFYHAPQRFAEIIVRQFAPPSVHITAFRIGKLAVVGVPGEPTSHLGRAIKAYGLSLGFSCVLVVSHVNGWMGYILDAGDYDRGGYEATLSFYGRDEGEKVVRAAEQALMALSGSSFRSGTPNT